MKGYDKRGMPLYPKPKAPKGKGGVGLKKGVPKEGLADPSLRRDIGNVPGLAKSR